MCCLKPVGHGIASVGARLRRLEENVVATRIYHGHDILWKRIGHLFFHIFPRTIEKKCRHRNTPRFSHSQYTEILTGSSALSPASLTVRPTRTDESKCQNKMLKPAVDAVIFLFLFFINYCDDVRLRRLQLKSPFTVRQCRESSPGIHQKYKPVTAVSPQAMSSRLLGLEITFLQITEEF